MSKEITRDIKVITAEFIAIKQQTTRMILNGAIEMGRRLCEAKLMLNHGEWGAWLKDEADISHGTANNLMRIFDEYGAAQSSLFGAVANSQTFGNLTYSKAVALLAVPSDEREEFAETVDAEHLSTRELQRAIKERNDAVAEKEKAERVADEKKRDLEEAAEKVKQLEEELQGIEEDKADLLDELEKLRNTASAAIVASLPDQAAIDAAAKEAAAAAKKDAEEKLKKKIEKAEEARIKAEAEKQKAEEALAAQKLANEKDVAAAVSAAEKEKNALAAQLDELQKKLAVSSSSEITVFKLHYESAQESINKMLGLIDNISDTDSRTKLAAALRSLCYAIMENVPEA